MARAKRAALFTGEQIAQSILVFRGHKVLLDEDLATPKRRPIGFTADLDEMP